MSDAYEQAARHLHEVRRLDAVVAKAERAVAEATARLAEAQEQRDSAGKVHLKAAKDLGFTPKQFEEEWQARADERDERLSAEANALKEERARKRQEAGVV